MVACVARKIVPRLIQEAPQPLLFKASFLSPTRITAYATRTSIAANLNGSLSFASDGHFMVVLLRNSRSHHQQCFFYTCTLRPYSAIECVSIDKIALLLAASVGFEHVNGVDGVPRHTLLIHKLHCQSSVHHHVGKEVCITEAVTGQGFKLFYRMEVGFHSFQW